MKLAAVQYRPPKGKPDAARADIVRLVDEACGRGADLVVLPEMATSGYVWASKAELLPHAEVRRGPTFRALAERARRHRAWVVCGFPERFHAPGVRGPTGAHAVRLYNSALVVSPDGELATCYRKVLLYDADETWAEPGWRRAVCPASFGRIVPGICMDINDPRFIRHLVESHADVLAFCTNWVEEGTDVHPYWRERLTGWTGWAVAANAHGSDRGVGFSGRSAILAPGGRVVAHAETTGDAIVFVDTREHD
ncbi:MAG: carbon-nitrogen hydrolase family protein [Myxococcota bacterium]|nr:carbon-nitrogen hydrolase family protein [Myxococcota bacterium]MEC8424136.1 carbon-nitrogen hydrolase family protein [Myxococcota bacterium]